MKILRSITLIALAMVLITVPIMGQGVFTLNAQQDPLANGTSFQFTATLIGVDTLTSNSFSLTKYDGDLFTTYPIHYGRLLTSVTSKPRVTNILEGTLDNSNWFTVDTIGVVTDSTETYGTGTLNFNSKKAMLYRMKIYGTTGNDNDTTIKYSLYAPRED